MTTMNVRSGDSLSSIAQRYGVSLQDLIKANPQEKNPNVIQPGDTITIPEKRAPQDRSTRSIPPPGVNPSSIQASCPTSAPAPAAPAPDAPPPAAPTAPTEPGAPAGSVNQRVLDATKAYIGTSTAAGPDGGNLACAWAVNNILSNAGLAKVGDNPNYVPSVKAALDGGRGTQVDAKDAQPGDIVIFPNSEHIGVYMGNGVVESNSSSAASFTYQDGIKPGMSFYRLNS